MEDDLSVMYLDVMSLIYRDCIWSKCHVGIPCHGYTSLHRLIKSPALAYDMNNSVIVCQAHKQWLETSLDALRMLHITYPRLTKAMSVGILIDPKSKPSFGALKSFLSENAPKAIKAGSPSFPSLMLY